MSSIETLFHAQPGRLISESGPRGGASEQLTALPGANPSDQPSLGKIGLFAPT